MKKQLTEFDVIWKRNQKMNQKRLVLDRKYAKMLGLRKEKLEARKQKEIDRYEKKRKKSMEIELHNLTSKRKRKEPVDKTVSKLKAKALAEIQKYCKYKRAVWSTKWPMVQLFDTMQWVKLDKKVHWWHLFPQSNYRWMMFDELNIYPISSWGNRKQLDTVGERINNIPKDNLVYIVERSKNKESIIYTRADYEAIIEKYKDLNRIEEKRLAIYKKKANIGETKVD
jgi:hypothetical protein